MYTRVRLMLMLLLRRPSFLCASTCQQSTLHTHRHRNTCLLYNSQLLSVSHGLPFNVIALAPDSSELLYPQ